MNNQIEKTVNRTPNPDCPACNAERIHTKEEWEKYHPNSGQGISWDMPVKKGG